MENANALLDGFTVQGGNANPSVPPYNAGGAVYATASGTLRNLTVRYNTSSGNGGGGGMYLRNVGTGMLTAVNCTVYDNAAHGGGGMVLVNRSTGTLTAVNCTVYNNESNSNGGGIWLRNIGTGPITVANSILFGNTATSQGPDVYQDGANNTAATLTNCLLGSAAAGGTITIMNPVGTDDGSENILGDPLFASTTLGSGNFLRLSNTSPALDAGDNSLVPDGVTTDLAGNARIQNTTVDLGAYEGAYIPSRIYVDADVSSATSDGSSWADAYASLTAALSAANFSDSIFVAAGTYTPSTVGLANARLRPSTFLRG